MLSLKHLFAHSIRWNFFGGIAYECIYAIHLITTMYVASNDLYALATMVHMLVLASKYIDSFFTAHLPAEWQAITQSRQTFRTALLYSVIIPMMILAIMVCCIIHYNNPTGTIGIYALICAESWISFARKALNLAWMTQQTVSTELLLFSIKIIFFWSTWHWYHDAAILFTITLMHALTLSSILSYLLYQFSTTLPQLPTQKTHYALTQRLAAGITRIAKHTAATPTITGFFAQCAQTHHSFGIYCLSKLLNRIQALTSLLIAYSGSALMARIHTNTYAQHITQKYAKILNTILLTTQLITLVGICYGDYMHHIIIYSIIVIGIIIIDCANIFYENLAQVTHNTILFAFLRLTECLIIAYVACYGANITHLLLTCNFIRFIILTIFLASTHFALLENMLS